MSTCAKKEAQRWSRIPVHHSTTPRLSSDRRIVKSSLAGDLQTASPACEAPAKRIDKTVASAYQEASLWVNENHVGSTVKIIDSSARRKQIDGVVEELAYCVSGKAVEPLRVFGWNQLKRKRDGKVISTLPMECALSWSKQSQLHISFQVRCALRKFL
ncbi:hypothetical protein C8R48DRAFT_763044 [Suillus tomentosus]|nr:hypothetical protein C8R48DRAFT_763044 [Suillus tomentosus]